MTWPLVLCIAVASAFGGFVLGWRQCEEQHRIKTQLRTGWERIKANAISDGILDQDSRPVEKQK